MFRRVQCLLACLACVVVVPTSHAQSFPSKPVRMVVPFSAGGAADVPARLVAQRLSEVLGQQFVVDNRPGAGSTIGAEIVAKAPPDGYTLLCMTNTHFVSASLYRKLAYDAVADFAPITEFGEAPNVLVVHPSFPAKSVSELIAAAKAQPGRIDFASSGNGSSQHLFGALFTSMAGIQLTHVPYKGSAQAATDLIAGQVKVGFPGIAIALPHVRTGKLRALGVTSARRSIEMPDVPPIAEAGLKGYDATLWVGLAAPRATPKPVIDKLYATVVQVVRRPEVKAALLATGTEVAYQESPERFGAFMRGEFTKWAKVVRESGASVQ